MNAPWLIDVIPTLRRPVLLAAFEGWNDAGDAASAALDHLETAWQAERVAELDADEFYVYTDTRPRVALVDGLTRSISWPSTTVSVASPPGAEHDVVLVRGVEPNLRWQAYCHQLVDIAAALGVTRTVTLGALLADVPHTRPIPVTGTASDPATAEQLGLTSSRYEGPTGIVGVLQDAFAQRDLQAVSFWVAVPHYASAPPCPKASLALLRRVEDLLDLPVPLGDLPDLARLWERQVDEAAAEDSDVAEYVASLEDREPQVDDLPEASGDAIAKEFERYLRRRDDS